MLLNNAQAHYGPKVISWLKAMLTGQEVLPLALVGPNGSGKAFFIEALKSWVRVHYLQGVLNSPVNEALRYSKVLVAENHAIPKEYTHDRFIEIKSWVRPRVTVANHFAVVGCYSEVSGIIPDCAIIVQLNKIECDMPDRRNLITELLK